MSRTGRVPGVIAAPAEREFAALVEPAALSAWLPPDGMSGRFERFEARVGGSYRMILTHADGSAAPGKSTADSDIVEARFVDPAYARTMTMAWEVSEADGGTRVEFRAENVPTAISAEDHAAGLASSLANLAVYVEEGRMGS